MLGDFNELISRHDKLGGNLLNPRHVQLFKECLDSYSMVDLGFHGPKYTWVNKRDVGQFIQERLDRGFANPLWSDLYPEAAINDLARTHSDHCLVLLKFENAPASKLTRPFRFQPMWMSHPLFSGILRDSWADDLHLKPNVDKFTADVKIWNKEVFGNLFHRKNRVEARLKGVQTSLAFCPNDHLLSLDAQLRKDHFEILQQEEEFWSVKSRYNWLIQGDRNTKFFHISAVIRRKRNRISCLMDSLGN